MNTQTILFLDNTYPHEYQVSTLEKQAIGGTESSIIKTSIILSKLFNVIVAQKHRETQHIESTSLKFIPKSEIYNEKPDFIVVLRKYPLLKKLQKKFPKAQLFLWIHTYKNTEYVLKRIGLSKTKATIICNSNTHKKSINKILNNSMLGKLFSLIIPKTQVEFCYNPVNRAPETLFKRDKNKLLFFSSPNKGLQQVINCFNEITKQQPDLKLYIANPGYNNDSKLINNKNITVLGSLPHKQMMQHVAQSLCVFYPQDSFAETFGLIYAEANAYGIPVLAHDIGSAEEILDSSNLLVDVNNSQAVLDVIISWQNEFPDISYNEKFSDEKITLMWRAILIQA